MPKIDVYLKDGHIVVFQETYYDSYRTTLRYENGVAIIKDAFGSETAFPLENIEKIVKESDRR